MSVEQIDNFKVKATKAKVKRLHALLKLQIPNINLGQCYEIYSKVAGHRNWNTMSAVLKGEQSSPVRAESIIDLAAERFGSEEAAFE